MSAITARDIIDALDALSDSSLGHGECFWFTRENGCDLDAGVWPDDLTPAACLAIPLSGVPLGPLAPSFARLRERAEEVARRCAGRQSEDVWVGDLLGVVVGDPH